MTDLTIGDETFNVEVEGDSTRPALILSNALSTDLTMWDGQMPSLAKHFRVIRYDSRGHGGSGGAATPASIARLGRDALAILDALGIEKAHWLGLSMGGAVGLWLLANAPERIERAILANTAPRLGSPEIWNARITAVLANGMEELADTTIGRWFGTDFSGKAPERVAAIRELVLKTPPEGYAACSAALRDMDLRETLRDIGHEILVISGRDDPVVPQADVGAFVAGLVGAQHVALASRHMSNIEAETEFNAAIVKFLTAAPQKARKAAPAKAAPTKAASTKATTPAKRGGASRRSNAARNPLKKPPAKRATTKKTMAATTPRKKPVATRRRPTTKAVATRRTAQKVGAKKVVAKRPAAKAPRKKVPAKVTGKVTTRRSTPTVSARAPVKTAVKNAKPAKAATKAKNTLKANTLKAKNTGKATTKKLPVARRKPVTKPRRPTGRRKP